MKETEITIYDHNIWGNMPGMSTISNRNALIGELISYHDADFVSFQECNPKTSRNGDVDIEAVLAPEYKEVKTEAGRLNFTPIFYKENRFTVIESGFFAYPGLNDLDSKSLTYAVFEENETKVRVGIISTHFWWMARGENDNLQRIDNARVLLENIKRIKDKYDIPVFAMGDLNCGFNADQGEEPYFFLKEQLLDVREIAPISTDTLTHHDYPPRNENAIYTAEGRREPVRTLDHFFVTEHKNVAIDSFEVDTSDEAYASSDHFPLIVHARVFGE
ncbi:MAG: hypothetical protein IJY23_07770 [Clostridia bacterium]|nr:hypothetical protein [Clostridia bacterium]